MKKYEEKNFEIPELSGISEKTIEEHLKLYSGYVKHTNLILEKIQELGQGGEENSYLIGELRRRLGFEFDGMRNHEYYFSQFEGSAQDPDEKSAFVELIKEEFGGFEKWMEEFRQLATTRGIGWAMLMYDVQNNRAVNVWVDEQQMGHLLGLQPLLALDMWEHSFMLDYSPSDKKKYIDAFFQNLNWGVIEARMDEIRQG